MFLAKPHPEVLPADMFAKFLLLLPVGPSRRGRRGGRRNPPAEATVVPALRRRQALSLVGLLLALSAPLLVIPSPRVAVLFSPSAAGCAAQCGRGLDREHLVVHANAQSFSVGWRRALSCQGCD